MITENIFEIDKRRMIYNYIFKNPGVHFRKICRELNIPKTTIDYHLRYLKKRGFLLIEHKNGYIRYYTDKKIGGANKKIINILRETVPRNIVLYLVMFPNSSQAQMMDFAKRWKQHPSKIGYHLNKHHTTLGFHLKKLVEMDIIGHENNGNEIKYLVKNVGDILDLFIVYKKSLLGDANGRYLVHFENLKPDVVDAVIHGAFDIFPHPYYC